MVARFSASTSQIAPCPLIWTTARLSEILPSSAPPKLRALGG
jgi:hypothetical protein